MQELRGEVWAYASSVMCFIDGQLLGDEKELLKWSHREWDYRDSKPEALYQAITEDFYSKYLKNSQASSAVCREVHKVWKRLERLSDGRAGTGAGRRASTAVAVPWFLPCDGRARAGDGEAGGEHRPPRPRMAEPLHLSAASKGQTLAQMPDMN